MAEASDDPAHKRGSLQDLLVSRAFLPLVLVLAFLLRWQGGADLRTAPDERGGALGEWIVDDEATAHALRRVELALAQGRVPLADAAASGGEALDDPASPVPAAAWAAVARIADTTSRGSAGDPALRGHDEAALEGVLLRSGPLLGLLLALLVHLAARAMGVSRTAALCACAVAACAPPLFAPLVAGRLSEAVFGWLACALLVRSFARMYEPRDTRPDALVDGVLEALLGGLLAGLAVACWAPSLVVVLAGVVSLLRAAAEREQAAARARGAILLLLVAAFALRLPLEEGPWAGGEGAFAAWARFSSTLFLVLAAPFAVVLMLSKRKDEPRRVVHVALLAALVLMAVAWVPDVWREVRAGLAALMSPVPLSGPAARETVAVLALLVVASLVAWRTHLGFFLLVAGAMALGIAPFARDGAALCALVGAFLAALVADRASTWPRRGAAAAACLCVVAAFGEARAGDPGLREERLETALGLRALRRVMPSSAPWNDPAAASQASVLAPVDHAARVRLHGRRAVCADEAARLASAAMEARVRAVEASAAEPALDALARGMRALGATHVVAAPRFLGAGRIVPGGAWAQLCLAPAGVQRIGEFELVHASPRRVGIDGRAALDGGAAGAALSIWKLAGKAEDPARPKEPEFRAR